MMLDFEITQRSLPPGLFLDPQTGVISGLPSLFGDFSFTVTLTHAAGNQIQQSFSIQIALASSPDRPPRPGSPSPAPQLIWDLPRLVLQDLTALARQAEIPTVEVSASELRGLAFDFINRGGAIDEPVQTCVLIPAGISFESAQIPLQDTIQVLIDGSLSSDFTARLLPAGESIPPACNGQNRNGAVLVTLTNGIPANARVTITIQIVVE